MTDKPLSEKKVLGEKTKPLWWYVSYADLIEDVERLKKGSLFVKCDNCGHHNPKEYIPLTKIDEVFGEKND